MQSDDDPTDFERLIAFITAPVDQFALAIATADEVDTLAECRTRARALASAAGVRVGDVNAVKGRPIIDQLATVASEHDVLFVAGVDALLLDPVDRPLESWEIEQWNWDRDRLPSTLSTRVVLWMRLSAARALASRARDLSDFVMARFHFRPRQRGRSLRTTAAMGRLSADETAQYLEDHAKKESKRLLEAVLRQRDPSSVAYADAAVQRSDVARAEGDLDEAEIWLDRALVAHRSLGADAEIAQIRRKQALLQSMRGNHVGALAVLRDEVLPSSEGRLRAQTLGDIADMLERSGDLDAAVITRREQVLPAWHRIGDMRETAVAQSRLADLQAARGEFDAALDIWRIHVRPVFTELGARREDAVTLRKIGATSIKQGRLDDALSSLRHALSGFEELGDELGSASVMADLARVLLIRGDREGALQILRPVLPVVERLGAVALRDDVASLIAEASASRDH